MTKPTRGTVNSHESLFSILHTLKALNQAGVSEIADRTGVSKSTVHKHLKTLKKHDFVVKQDGDYQLGARFLTYGGIVRDNNELVNLFSPKVKNVSKMTNETCTLAVEEFGKGIYMFMEWGDEHIPRTQPLGERFYLHTNASGKAILSKMQDQRIEEVLEKNGLPRMTPNTVTDKEALLEELDKVRAQGYATNQGERFEGISSVAVGFQHPETKQIGSISIGTQSVRLNDESCIQEYAEILLQAVNEIDLELKFG
jgi:DNA-binding IclR family transcriptional regulator